MKHICPACGREWECVCEPRVIAEHCMEVGAHHNEIACSMKCAEHLSALMTFLRRYGL